MAIIVLIMMAEFKETRSDFLKQVERELRESLFQLLAVQYIVSLELSQQVPGWEGGVG